MLLRICVKILVYDAILHMRRIVVEDIRTNLLQGGIQRGLRWNRRRHCNINASKQILFVRFLLSRTGYSLLIMMRRSVSFFFLIPFNGEFHLLLLILRLISERAHKSRGRYLCLVSDYVSNFSTGAEFIAFPAHCAYISFLRHDGDLSIGSSADECYSVFFLDFCTVSNA